jgi:hypothetical protein
MDRWRQQLILEGVYRLVSVWLWCDGVSEVEILKDVRL